MVSHWSDRYLGREYFEVGRCGGLINIVHREIYRRELLIPEKTRRDHVIDIALTYADATDDPKEGDGVTMRVAEMKWHSGVYVEIERESYVLHALKNAGLVCRHRLRDLEKIGLALDGFWRFR